MNGPPLVAYEALRRWSPEQFLATLQGYFLPASAVGMAGYWMAGLWSPAVTRYYLVSLPVVLVAVVLGRLLNRRIHRGRFLFYVHIGLVVIGMILLVQSACGVGPNLSGLGGEENRLVGGLENRPASAQPGRAGNTGAVERGFRRAGTNSVEPRNALDDRMGRRLEAGLERRAGPGAGREPFDWLPRLSARQSGCERWLAGWTRDGRLPSALEWLEVGCGGAVAVDRPEIFWRASGLNRPGMIAHLTVPRLQTRLAIGIENALAHAVVDRLLGFDRAFAESRLQLTPVEWGIWTFLILRALDGVDSSTAADRPPAPDEGRPFGPGDLRLDRAGPDPFDPTGLGAIVTVRWGVRIGSVAGSVRLWIPEFLVRPWAESPDRREKWAVLPSTARPPRRAGPSLAASCRASGGPRPGPSRCRRA